MHVIASIGNKASQANGDNISRPNLGSGTQRGAAGSNNGKFYSWINQELRAPWFEQSLRSHFVRNVIEECNN